MAKRVTKKVNSTELDSKEFFAAIAQIEEEKGIKKGYMMEKITQALISAYRRDHEGVGDNLTVEANEETGVVRMFLKKEVVEEVDNPGTEISLEEARLSLPRVELGDTIRIEVKPKNFGRIAAQTARQVIIQGIREAEQGMIYDEFTSKEWRCAGPPRVLRCSSPAPTPGWSSACLSWRCLRSMTGRWRSSPSPGRRAPAPNWPSGPLTPMWTPSVPVSAPGDSG